MHTAAPSHTLDARLLGVFAPLAAWACYAQLGAKYVAVLGCTWLCLNLLRQQDRLRETWHDPTMRWLLAFLALLALSTLWSPAPPDAVLAHLWTYSMPVLAMLIAAGCPPRLAERALAHFAWASAVVGGLFLLRELKLFTTDPASRFWMATLEATGNQRVVTSLLLAIGAALGLWLGVRRASVSGRASLILPSLLAMAGLVLQDRRTGMVLLPVMLLVWALASQRGPARKAAGLAAVAVVVGIGWLSSDTVRLRFAEGVNELRQYRPNDQVDTSWGQRVRMLQVTSGMVRERPVLGHGAGSWQTLWQQRVTPGTALAVHSTPHNEYLLFTVQLGFAGLALFLVWLARTIVGVARGGPAGVGALMLWTAMAISALFNAVFRDAKFALPLLLLAGLAGALARAGRSEAMGQSTAWPAPR